jgi:DNA-binding MarR family transcriptional regulator
MVDLLEALELLSAEEPLRSGVFSLALQEHLGCSARLAQDAITILRRGRYLTGQQDENDRRRIYYRLSDRGHYLINHPKARSVLYHAHRAFTGCPSRHVRQQQERIAATSGPDAYLIKWERQLLTAPRSLPPPGSQPNSSPLPGRRKHARTTSRNSSRRSLSLANKSKTRTRAGTTERSTERQHRPALNNLETIIESTSTAIDTGLVPLSARDLVAAIHLHTTLEELETYDTTQRLLEECHLLVAAVGAANRPGTRKRRSSATTAGSWKNETKSASRSNKKNELARHNAKLASCGALAPPSLQDLPHHAHEAGRRTPPVPRRVTPATHHDRPRAQPHGASGGA